MTDIVITPASGNINFYNTTNTAIIGSIRTTSANNIIIEANGGIILGNTASDVYVGDGVNNINIIYEQDGAIRAAATKTLTVGAANSFVVVASNTSFTRPITITAITANGSNGVAGQLLATNGASTYWTNGSSRVYSRTTATAGQNTFTTSSDFATVDVFYNGVHLSTSDYTVINPTTVQLTENAKVGAVVELVGYGTVSFNLGTFTAAGSNTQLQFNDSGVANGSAALAFNKTSNTLSFTNTAHIAGIVVTTTGTSLQTVDSWLLNTFRSAQYFVSVTDNGANNYQSQTIQMMHDGTTAHSTDFAQMITNTSIGVFSSSSNTTHALLQFTPTKTSTTIKMSRTLISV